MICHERGVSNLDFSHDGRLLLSIGNDDFHTVFIHDWKEGTLIATSRGHSSSVYCARFNYYQVYGLCSKISGKEVAQPGQSIYDSEACYTFITCGERHIKFWTLAQETDPETFKKEWKLQGNLGKGGILGDVNSITSLAFVDDSELLFKRNVKTGNLDQVLIDPMELYDSKDGEVKVTDRKQGRIIAGTHSGDINIYVQPLQDIVGYTEEALIKLDEKGNKIQSFGAKVERVPKSKEDTKVLDKDGNCIGKI